MSPPDCPLPLNPALHRCRTVSVRLSVYGGILWRPPAWSLFLCVFLFLYVTALQLVDMLFDTKVSLSTTVPDHTHPPHPTPLQEPEQGRTGVRARRSTAHQDDAAALLRIRFMWTLHFGSYMILLPCGVINDDDIYRRPVVGLCILVYRDETSPVTKSAFFGIFCPRIFEIKS